MATVYLASTSQEKLSSVRNAFGQLKPGCSFVTRTVGSGVSEQPVDKEIEDGAFNRVHGLASLAKSEDYIVAFESGILLDADKPEVWGAEVTFCVVVHGNTTTTAWSPGRQYPYFVVAKARQEGILDLKTHDTLVTAWYDSHPEVTSPQTREEAMTKACLDCLRQL